MIIQSIRVKNFRSLKDLTVPCDSLTAMIGPNGGGKSSVLRALELFYAPSPRIEPDDFYNGAVAEDVEVEIELTFMGLSDEARSQFAPYVRGQGLTVVRVFSLRDGRLSNRFHGSRLQHQGFHGVRQASGAISAREKYSELKGGADYSDLPTANSQAAVFQAVQEWEDRHPERCTMERDDGQFFGFSEVARGYLGRFTRLISVPAVRDASEEAAEGRGRPISELMDLVVRNRLASQESVGALRSQTLEKYTEILGEAEKQTDELGAQLSKRLAVYVPGGAVRLTLNSSGTVDIQLPKAEVKLVEDEYETDVTRTGHGLQRGFIMAVLQELADAQAGASHSPAPQDHSRDREDQQQTASDPSVTLAIEEPELYQHPSRQRHLANILSQLAHGSVSGVTDSMQVIYVTHSPLFVGIDRFDQLRMLRKVPGEAGGPRVTAATQVSGDSVAEAIWDACDQKDRNGQPIEKFTWDTLKPRLEALMTPWMAEGFFADVAVLVEGVDDRAALLGAAFAREIDLESEGYAVIPCGGKASMDRPAVIFRKFKIPVFLLWDGDRGGKDARPQENHRLLRIVGAEVNDYPATVAETYACFEINLEDTVRQEIGEAVFDGLLQACKEDFELGNRDDAIKNPFIFREILRRAEEQGKTSNTLNAIVDAIMKLKGNPTGGA